ncbi:hypothetical protein DFH28DRAFT_1119607 [Melampsora americana]|nr:hypothetical protein DFH28DRAFT_1119607 [Melampsora americana]
MTWNPLIVNLLWRIQQYYQSTLGSDDLLASQWTDLIKQSQQVWESYQKEPNMPSEPLDDLDMVEQELIIGVNDEEDAEDLPEMDDCELKDQVSDAKGYVDDFE